MDALLDREWRDLRQQVNSRTSARPRGPSTSPRPICLSSAISASGAVAVLCVAALTFLDSSAAATSKPNGATILYTDVGTNGLWTMNLDGSNKSQIKPATNCDDPAAYSPDGSHVAYYDCKSAR